MCNVFCCCSQNLTQNVITSGCYFPTAIDDSHEQPITNLTISTALAVYEVGSDVTFSITVSEGSHVTYNIQYGDGASEVIVHPNVLSFQTAVYPSHAYSLAQIWTVTVTASNAEGSVENQAKVRVIEPMRSLRLQTAELTQFPNSTFRYNVVLAEPGLVLEDITCSFDFGDGASESLSLDSMTDVDSITTDHSYYLGVYDVSVTCTNGISSLGMNRTVTAEEIITGLSIESDKAVGKAGETFYLTVSTASGSNVAVTLDLGNGQTESRLVGSNRRGGSLLSFAVNYADIGRYTVSVSAENLVNSVTAVLPHTLHVLNLVKDLVLTAPDIISLPPGVADVRIEYRQLLLPPTDVLCEFSSPHLPGFAQFSDQISAVSSLNASLNFNDSAAIGINRVVVNCSNTLSYQVLETDIVMEAVIEGVSVSVSDNFIMVKGAVDVNLTVESGSHAQYQLDFGDGEVVTGVFPDTVLNHKKLTFWHVYEQAGIYNLTGFTWNRKSDGLATKTLRVLEEVTDVMALPLYQPLDHNDTLQGGHGPQGDKFPLERKLIVITTLATGNDITYAWDFDDGTPLVYTRDSVIEHSYAQAGWRRVKVNASNALFFDTFYIMVELQQTILMHTLTNDGPTEAFRTVNFTLQLARTGTDSCFVWDMGDGSDHYVYGGAHCAQYTSTPPSAFRSLEDSVTDKLQIRQEHMYQSNRTFYVNVFAYNLVSDGQISDVAIMSGVSCHFPVVHLVGGGQLIDNPTVRVKSDWISVESTVDINCEVGAAGFMGVFCCC